MTKEELRIHWQREIERFKKSGLNKSRWCRENKINLKTFCNWYNRYAKNTLVYEKEVTNIIPTESKPSWISVDVIDKSSNSVLGINPQIPAEDSIASMYSESKASSSNVPKENIIVHIGRASIEVKEGFDKVLFLEVARILGALC